MKQIWAITRKELTAYFGSPMALIFVGAFLVVTLFTFFWVETFFARTVADVRPLFRWMPLTLLFLVATLTMRQWSEEQRSGTLETLLTLPVGRVQLVLAKFLAVMLLVALALALTLTLPLTVQILGPLDWGPVVGGYLAALLMASAYAAIGLALSSRTDNQIVALIATVFVGGLFYLIGTQALTALVGQGTANVLRAIGTGSRFESIERGVVDLRDLVYYLSLSAVFLALNVVSLDAKRWSRGPNTAAYRGQVILSLVLIVANLAALNAWLAPLGRLRADLTADRTYSLSPTTRTLIAGLQEPLLIRGYFSEKTHPYLAPLVPTIQDMLSEYQVASGGRIRVEVLDPKDDAELEAEANQTYGIRPTPFRITGRYETSVINSYFDLLVRYGDQHATLGFADLIEVEQLPTGQIDVRLRNLEYDLTRTVKRVAYGFQSLESAFASIQEPIKLTAYVTPRTLPAGLEDVPGTVDTVGASLLIESGGKFQYQRVDPDAPDSPVTRQSLYDTYGLRPIATSLFSPTSYYLHLLLQIGDQAQILYPSGDLTEAEIRGELEAAVKRAAPGFLKTVGVWLPTLAPVMDPFGGAAEPISSWRLVQQQLRESYTVRQVDLSGGRVPGDVDALLMIAPQNLTDRERFAVDQYLMRGGAVVVVGSTFALDQGQFYGGITMERLPGTLSDLLGHYGVAVGDAMVLDPRNEPFPIQVARSVRGIQVYEIQEVPYPYFVDVRGDGMAGDSPITANLPAVTLQWASPLIIDEELNRGREVTVLLRSSDESWLSAAMDVQPQPDLYPPYGFPVQGEQAAHPLAVAVRGSFSSYFKDRPSPFEPGQDTLDVLLGTVESSPPSARLVVIASAQFVDDAVLQLSQSLSPDRFLNSLQLVQNAVDWAVEDEDLLAIRSRGTFARLLKPLEKGQQTLWEGLNYGLALLALVAIGLVWTVRRRSEQPMELVDPDKSAADPPGADPEQGGDDE